MKYWKLISMTNNYIKEIDIDHIVLETDSPYLSPQEKIGKKNTPINLKYIIRKLSEELNISEEEVIEITTKNAKRLFKI